jgi:arylsulfatase A-like enzyme
MQGRDISELYLGKDITDWRAEFFYEHPSIRSEDPTIESKDFIPASEALVRKDWKYFYWPDFKYEQLFHIAEDPLEENDLAKDPKHAEKLNEMRARFKELKEAAK